MSPDEVAFELGFGQWEDLNPQRGEGRADTRAFALGYGGAARAPPARPGEDKGAAGDEEEKEEGNGMVTW